MLTGRRHRSEPSRGVHTNGLRRSRGPSYAGFVKVWLREVRRRPARVATGSPPNPARADGVVVRAIVSAVAAVSWMVVGVIVLLAVHSSWRVEAGLFALGVGVVWARGALRAVNVR